MSPLCVKCRKSKRTQLVCLKCYNSAIEDLTLILDGIQAQLQLATVRTHFLQAIVRSAEDRAAGKQPKVINLSLEGSKTSMAASKTG